MKSTWWAWGLKRSTTRWSWRTSQRSWRRRWTRVASFAGPTLKKGVCISSFCTKYRCWMQKNIFECFGAWWHELTQFKQFDVTLCPSLTFVIYFINCNVLWIAIHLLSPFHRLSESWMRACLVEGLALNWMPENNFEQKGTRRVLVNNVNQKVHVRRIIHGRR